MRTESPKKRCSRLFATKVVQAPREEAHAMFHYGVSSQEAAKGRAVPLSCLKLAIDSTQLLLMWSLRNLEQSASPSGAAVTALSKAVASFCDQLDAIGAAEDNADVQLNIQKTQSNLFLVFSARKLKVCLPHSLQSLRFKDTAMQASLSRSDMCRSLYINVQSLQTLRVTMSRGFQIRPPAFR